MKRLWYVLFCVFGICVVDKGYSQKIEDYFYPLNINFESRLPYRTDAIQINSAFVDNGELYIEDRMLTLSDYGIIEVLHNLENIVMTKDRIISKNGKRRVVGGIYRYGKTDFREICYSAAQKQSPQHPRNLCRRGHDDQQIHPQQS